MVTANIHIQETSGYEPPYPSACGQELSLGRIEEVLSERSRTGIGNGLKIRNLRVQLPPL